MNKPKLVFVAHAISGDVDRNLRKVISICSEIHSSEIIPVFPSFTWRHYLTNEPGDKELAEQVNEAYFSRNCIDEIWLYGDLLSEGMKKEIKLAEKYTIPVIAKTLFMELALKEFMNS